MNFTQFAQKLSEWAGKAGTFQVALGLIVIWALSGPIFHFNDTWQLVINTSTTIITFLMVFLIQNTQNRDSDALHIKIDELLRASERAHNVLVQLDNLDAKSLARLREKYQQLATSDEAKGSEGDVFQATLDALKECDQDKPQR